MVPDLAEPTTFSTESRHTFESLVLFLREYIGMKTTGSSLMLVPTADSQYRYQHVLFTLESSTHQASLDYPNN